MNVLIPMAGAGSRFAKNGYATPKPLLPIIDRATGEEVPMVISATRELINTLSFEQVIFVDRDYHKDMGVEAEISKYFDNVSFVTLTQLTEGQASTCLMAKHLINNDTPLLIGACDNGVAYSDQLFVERQEKTDVLVFTYRNHEAVLENPQAYGWIQVGDDNISATGVSVKKAISDNPLNDHAVVASFWFKKGSDFVRSAEKMIAENDRINGEFYADQVIKHALDLGLGVQVFEVERYFGWGTPTDYEHYMQTIQYWDKFIKSEDWLNGK